MSIERAVALLTPLFAAVSAWLTGAVASNLPFLPPIPAQGVTALMIAGFTAGAAAALKWLHGRSQYVLAERSAERQAAPVGASVADVERLARAEVQRAFSGLSLQYAPAGLAPPNEPLK